MRHIFSRVMAVLVLGVLLSAPIIAMAGVGPPPGPNPRPVSITIIPNLFNCTRIDCVVQKILDALALMAAPFVAIMILVGAFQIMTAAGDPLKFKNGRNTILYAAVGYTVILLASSVVPIVKSILGIR